MENECFARMGSWYFSSQESPCHLMWQVPGSFGHTSHDCSIPVPYYGSLKGPGLCRGPSGLDPYWVWGSNLFSQLFLLESAHPSSHHHTYRPPAEELPPGSASSQVSITESFWVQEHTERVPRYEKGTHLQHLTEFVSPSEKRNVITSPSYNANRSSAFIYNLHY